MKLDEAKEKFIQAWGALGSQWGINRTMAQIHALLLISPEALSADDIMQQLHISRGNANMNIRALIDWGLVQRDLKTGERKEFFSADKDIWRITQQVAKERKKRELDPLLKVLNQLGDVEQKDNDAEQFKATIADLKDFAEHADAVLEKFVKVEETWFFSTLLKILR